MKTKLLIVVVIISFIACKSKKQSQESAKEVAKQETPKDLEKDQKSEELSIPVEEEVAKPIEQPAPKPQENPAHKGEEPELYRLQKLEGEAFAALRKDAFSISNIQVINNMLYVDVQYSGGCAGAQFTLAWNGMVMKSMPPKVNLLLAFEDNDDCEALVTKKIVFDLNSLKEVNSEVFINVFPSEKSFKLTF